MHIEAIVFLPRQRQLGQKAPLRRAEPAARPFDRGLRHGIHAFRGGTDRVIVVADHGNGAVIDETHHGIDRPFRIGAIADDIAKADDPLRPAGAREIETRAERLPVGMDIGKDGQPHISSPSIIAPMAARALRDIKQQAACDVQSGRVRLQAVG